MTNRITAGIAAGILAVGLITGAAGAVLVSSVTTPNTSGHVTQMTGMHEAMDGMMGSAWMSGQGAFGMMGGQQRTGMMGGQHGSGMMGGQR